MNRGFSLLELLVAVLVVAVGLLGIAGLQLASAQNNRGALERSLAAFLAEDMLERARANPTVDYSASSGPPTAFADCVAGICSPAQLARFDVAAWKCALGQWRETALCQGLPTALLAGPGLPQGDGTVAVSGDAVTVAITWQSSGERQLTITGGR